MKRIEDIEAGFERIRRPKRHGPHLARRQRLVPPRCNGKNSYRSEEFANEVRGQLAPKHPLYIYRCPYCFFWHLTHRKQHKRHG